MALLHQLFTVEELQSLDGKELEIVKAAIQNELRKPGVANAIRNNVRAVFQSLKPAAPGGPSPQTP